MPSAPDLLERCDVLEIHRPAGDALEADQIRDRCDARRRAVDVDDHRSLPELIEVDRLFDEQIHRPKGSVGVPHREHRHPLMSDPPLADGRVGESTRLDEQPRAEADAVSA